MFFNKEYLPFKNGTYEPELLKKAEQAVILRAQLGSNLPIELIKEINKVILHTNAYYATKYMKNNDSIGVYAYTDPSDKTYHVWEPNRNDYYINYLNVQKYLENTNKRKKYLHCSYKTIHKVNTILFNTCSAEDKGEYGKYRSTLKINRLLDTFVFNHILQEEINYYRKPIDIAMLYGMLSTEESNLWSIGRAMFLHADQLSNLLDLYNDINHPDFYRLYLNMMLDAMIEEIQYMQKYLKTSSLQQNIQKHADKTREKGYDGTPLPAHAELLLKKFVVSGEIKRGEVKYIINKKQRTATNLIHKLLDMNYIESDTSKGNIRLTISNGMGHDIFPNILIGGATYNQ